MVESRAGKWQRYEQEDEFYKRVNWRRDRESLDLCLSGGRGFRAEFELARQLKTGEWDVLLPNASPDELREHLNALGLPLPYGFRKEFNQIDTSFQKSA